MIHIAYCAWRNNINARQVSLTAVARNNILGASKPYIRAMLIKKADDKTRDLEALQTLAKRADASPEARKKIENEIRNIQSGVKGEAEAAYEIDFHFGPSKNWAVIHDLRLECDGRVAQIDHVLINRFLDVYVCESKRFGEGVSVNEHGEFAAFYAGKPYGVPSPIEQNRRHLTVLESVFKTGQVALPKRLGFTISASLSSLVLVSKMARISRPKNKIDGIDQVIKNDQLRSRVERDMEKSDNNVLLAAKIIGQDTLEDLAHRLAAAHKPIAFDWVARFGLPAAPPDHTNSMRPVQPSRKTESTAETNAAAGAEVSEKEAKQACSKCGQPVTNAVAKFCWFNKPRFGGKVFCIDCQKTVPQLA